MALTSGIRVGPYEVHTRIGAGGMGEVWRARDTRLQRDVALKVLPEAFTLDADRIARLTREAQVLASLNHSNVAAIYGFEDGDGFQALVLEFVDGPTLADRLATGPLPLDEAIAIARQIADALAGAHEHGVIHRDLKPANIKVRPDGTVKVLDFGLAKALEVSSGVGGSGAVHGLSQSPTITSPAMTRAGVILGTAAYMSPEQARGRPADQRSDVWSFGCVLFEMLTGQRAFAGDEVSDTMAAVLRADPAWTDLPAAAPSSVRRLLRRCLEKDPKRRLADIRDARLELDDSILNEQAAPDAARPHWFGWRERLAWAAAVVAIVLAAVLFVMYRQGRSAAQVESPSQFVILPPEGTTLAAESSTMAISPDGRTIAFAANASEGSARLWIRKLESLESTPLAGTEGARMPFWSSDSQAIGFFADGKLKRVDLESGSVQSLADVDSTLPFGGTWSGSVILYAPGFGRPVTRVPAGGGPSTPVTSLTSNSPRIHTSPVFLPDGRRFLFAVSRGPNDHQIMLGSLDSTEPMMLAEGQSPAVYAAPGYLMYLKGDVLLAHPFDANRGVLTGDAIRLSSVPTSGGGVAFSASETGTLVYRPGSTIVELVWVDRQGTRLSVAAPAGVYADPALSPDGRYVAFARGDAQAADVWVMDLARQITTRFTTTPPLNNVPVWSPDSRTIAFASRRNGALDIFQRALGSTGEDQEVVRLNGQPIVFPSDWSWDGKYLMYYRSGGKTQLDTWVLPLTGPRTPQLLLGSEFNEAQGVFAPRGQWIAYVSDASGQSQVYVQSFPTPAQRSQVSTSGGSQPVWLPTEG
jgi:eukaryotic-like serine/threonine-protein kinase